ncbi:MAG: CDP-alcohol phosphatidyltransferase family protein [Oscillospiraceae bacterium]|nr:CDP-alcohol phosphatidyltransferase family protein [Oscillospiraceae bacterium]
MINKIKKSIPNILSLLNMTLGIIAILIVLRRDIYHKAPIVLALVCLGGILDLLDGYAAHKLNAFTETGKQLDSFADIITFGFAPLSVTVYLFHEINLVLIASLSVAYIITAVYRLIRYNLSEPSKYFRGLPITAAGIILTVYCTAFLIFGFYNSTIFTVVLMLILSLMMVSKVKIKRLL